MQWRVYAKLLTSPGCVYMRWYWCRELPEGSKESAQGFTSRAACEADAIARGCLPEDQADERRLSLSRLLGGPDLRGFPERDYEIES
jgi:hypothetical protein